MHNELTKIDIAKMKEELDYRRITLRPQLLEEVKTARSFGDLSENFEYKAAKREKNKNESRIRYLENMIRTARVIEDRSAPDAVGLYDKVTVFLEDDGEEETWQVVTTVRQDVLHGLISKESPHGLRPAGEEGGGPLPRPGGPRLQLLRRGPGHREGGGRWLRRPEPVLSRVISA